MSNYYASSDSLELIAHKVGIKPPTGFHGPLNLQTILVGGSLIDQFIVHAFYLCQSKICCLWLCILIIIVNQSEFRAKFQAVYP